MNSNEKEKHSHKKGKLKLEDLRESEEDIDEDYEIAVLNYIKKADKQIKPVHARYLKKKCYSQNLQIKKEQEENECSKNYSNESLK